MTMLLQVDVWAVVCFFSSILPGARRGGGVQWLAFRRRMSPELCVLSTCKTLLATTFSWFGFWYRKKKLGSLLVLPLGVGFGADIHGYS